MMLTLRTILSLAPLFCTVPSAFQEAQTEEQHAAFAYPEGRSGEIAEAFVGLFGSADEAAIRAFEESYRAASVRDAEPLEERIPIMLRFSTALGPLTPMRVLEQAEGRLVLLVRSNLIGTDFDLTLTFEKEAPGNLLEVGLEQASPLQKIYTEWETMSELLGVVRKDGKLPGLAVVIVGPEGIRQTAVAGVRRSDSNAPIEKGDRFHIGSVTKSFTATMIARLVEQGALRWDLPSGEAFPHLDQNLYAGRTLADFLYHRSGMSSFTSFNGVEMERLNGLPGTPKEQRAAWVAEVLASKPKTDDGSYEYSNAGYTVAAHMAEQATGKAWEDLIREHVFATVGLESAGFGWPVTESRTDEPYGHVVEASGTRPIAPDEYRLGAFVAPAGDIHCSIEDLGRFASMHLAGLQDSEGNEDAHFVQVLHAAQPPRSAAEPAYAFGWIVDQAADGTTRHWHNGTTGTYYAFIALYPERRTAFAVLMNTAQSAEPAAFSIERSLRERGLL